MRYAGLRPQADALGNETIRACGLMGREKPGLSRAIIVVSDVLIAELAGAPDQVQAVLRDIAPANVEYVVLNNEATRLAEEYVRQGALSPRMIADAQHIAVATVAQVDVLVSWNFKHIVNLDRIHRYNSVNLREGYALLEIRSPQEVLQDESEGQGI